MGILKVVVLVNENDLVPIFERQWECETVPNGELNTLGLAHLAKSLAQLRKSLGCESALDCALLESRASPDVGKKMRTGRLSKRSALARKGQSSGAEDCAPIMLQVFDNLNLNLIVLHNEAKEIMKEFADDVLEKFGDMFKNELDDLRGVDDVFEFTQSHLDLFCKFNEVCDEIGEKFLFTRGRSSSFSG